MDFGFEKNIYIWKKLGFSPFTHKCLNDVQVRHEVLVEDDGTIVLTQHTMVVKLLAIEDIHRSAFSILDNYGFKGVVFQKYAPRVEASKVANVAVTAAGSRSRQYFISRSGTEGSRWHATGGEQFNSNDFFISRERERRQDEAKLLKKEKH